MPQRLARATLLRCSLVGLAALLAGCATPGPAEPTAAPGALLKLPAPVAPPTATDAPPTSTPIPPTATAPPASPTPRRPVPTATKAKPTSTPKPSPTPKPTATPAPLTIHDLPKILNDAVKVNVAGDASVQDGSVVGRYTVGDDMFPATIARAAARDFVGAAYASGVPIKGAAVLVYQSDTSPGLMVFVGAHVAHRLPVSTWRDSVFGPTDFCQWVERMMPLSGPNLDEDGVSILGPWAP